MLVLLALASLGAKACAPIQTLTLEALGTPGAVSAGQVSYPGRPEGAGCSVTVKGGAGLGPSFTAVAAKLDQTILNAGWARDLMADADGPDGTAAGYGRGAERLTVSVSQTGAGPQAAYTVVLGLLSPSEPAASSLLLDPACLSTTAWAVDPAAEKIQVFGCRPPAEIPAPEADGFISYARPAVNGADGGFTRVKASPNAPAGKVAFVVQDNTGGSFTAQATVIGVLAPDGYMERGGLTVE